MPLLRWCHLGRVEYDAARALQTRLADGRARRFGGAARGDDVLLLLEHPPVVTLGRNAGEPPAGGVLAVRTDRGGGLTYHGPGQLVGYPVVALTAAGRGVRSFVASLEDALCDAARAFGVAAERRDGLPGVWTRDGHGHRKLASIGLGVRRGITVHGCALNVAARAEEGFAGFAPCGLEGVRVTSLESERGGSAPGMDEVARALAAALARRLDRAAYEISPSDLEHEPRPEVLVARATAPSPGHLQVAPHHGHRPTS